MALQQLVQASRELVCAFEYNASAYKKVKEQYGDRVNIKD